VNAPPGRCDDDGTHLRRFRVDDASLVAALLQRNLEHLAPWMPWARPEIANDAFQRARMRDAVASYDDDDGSNWEFAMCASDGTLIGACGILVRDGSPRAWYWVAQDASGRGHATRAAGLLTTIWREHRHEPRLEIRCDVANEASAAVPRRLGYRLDRIVDTEPETASETGRMMVWVVDRERDC
jgi:RimJ/RimL family protein N-acetyltransferase